MFNRLERHIAMTMARTTGITVLSLVILLVFFNFVDELDEVGKGDYTTADAFLVAALTVPRYMFEVFPVAALIGALVGLGGLASRSELVAMRAAGFSLRNILTAVLKAGMAMMLLVLAFGELVGPPAEQFGQEYRFTQQQGKVTLKTRYGFWARDGRAFINIRDLSGGTQLQDISIYEFDQQNRLILATHAARADFRGDHWELQDIAQSQLHQQQVETRRLDSARWGSLLDPALLSVVVVRPTMLPIWGLDQYIDFMHENGQSAVEYQVAYWLKIANPFATLVMLFLALPFVLGSQRSGSMGQRIFIGAVVGAGFFLLTRAMSYIAVVYNFNPALSALFPALLALSLSVLLLRRVR